jgi:CRISPR-associated protein Cas2
MYYIITYDIQNSKRRKKLSELLQMYGVRVNYSVFELDITKKELKEIVKNIKTNKLIKKKIDSIRFYYLPLNSIEKSFEMGNRNEPFEQNYNAI